MQGLSTNPNVIHFQDASGNVLVATGPNITNIALGTEDVVKFAHKLFGALSSDGGGGGGGSHCTTTVVQTFGDKGQLTGQTTTTTCGTGAA